MTGFTLERLASIVADRAVSGDPGSYTAKLIDEGLPECARKFGEEAIETVIAAMTGDRDRIRAEAADLLYHLLVLMHASGVSLGDVTAELERRTAQSGLQEKAGRKAP